MKRFKLLVTVVAILSCCAVVYVMLYKRSMRSVYTGNQVLFSFDAPFKNKPLVIWSNDFHISPINDLKHLLRPLGVKFIDKSLSGHCHITNTCAGRSTLKVININNAMDLNYDLIPKFYEAYKDDAEMKSVDAFVCFHPSSMCELFEPFNRSLIIIASTRYELGRFGKDRWTRWNENLKRYALQPWNVIGGNNRYDAEYITYFTGIKTVVLQSFCDYNNLSYNPTRKGYLVAPIHNGNVNQIFFKEFGESCSATNCTVEATALRAKYPSYKYSDLTAHMGMVYVPYQVSVMSMFEQYRMNIPMFFPSKELLTNWQYKYLLMNERTWSGTFGNPPQKSDVGPFDSNSSIPDPNNEKDEKAIRYWIEFSDFYQFPHIMYYDSVQDLVGKLEKIKLSELMAVSAKMREHNRQAKKELLETWTAILKKVADHSPNKPQ